DCSNPVRGVLLATYGSIIRTPTCTSPNRTISCTTTADCPLGETCNAATGLCTPQECVKLKHAFRRDDLAEVTETFVSLGGLVAMAPCTTKRSATANPPHREMADMVAVASPFCNAGTAAMNRGFSDGLDLDPYRRACNAGPAPDRLALEEVCQAWG